MVVRAREGAKRGAALATLTVALGIGLVAGACGTARPVAVDGPALGALEDRRIPEVRTPEFADIEDTGVVIEGEALAEVVEAAPPGLRITSVQIAVLSPAARTALGITGFRSHVGPGLIGLPIAGVNPLLGMYYLIVPVVNEGDEPVRNLKARAEFFDADGIRIWVEEQPVTHFPTRLGLNPPSLPNDPRPPPGELGLRTRGFNPYYFAGNVGIFTFAVPEPAVAERVRTWDLTFLVSET